MAGEGTVTGGSIQLVVLGNATGTGYTSREISSPATNLGGTPNQVNLPVQAGDHVAVTLISGSSAAAVNQLPASGAQLRYFTPGFTAIDQAMSSSTTNADFLPAFNANLVLAPPNQFSFGKLKRMKNAGTASLQVSVPGPGRLTLSGKGVKSQRLARGASASKAVGGAGTVKLLVMAKGKTKKRLSKIGHVKIKVSVTFTPAATEVAGTPTTQTKAVELIKKR